MFPRVGRFLTKCWSFWSECLMAGWLSDRGWQVEQFQREWCYTNSNWCSLPPGSIYYVPTFEPQNSCTLVHARTHAARGLHALTNWVIARQSIGLQAIAYNNLHALPREHFRDSIISCLPRFEQVVDQSIDMFFVIFLSPRSIYYTNNVYHRSLYYSMTDIN